MLPVKKITVSWKNKIKTANEKKKQCFMKINNVL